LHEFDITLQHKVIFKRVYGAKFWIHLVKNLVFDNIAEITNRHTQELETQDRLM
jgi:hypothetical protein